MTTDILIPRFRRGFLLSGSILQAFRAGHSTAGGYDTSPVPLDVSFRGAKRRGNLAVQWWITGRLRRKRSCLPEIATSAFGLLAMTNLRASRHRMRTAKVASLHGAQRAPLQTQLVHTVFTAACTGRECVAGRGMPLPYSALREAMGKTPLSTLNSRRPAGGYPRTGISSNPGRAPIPRRGSDCSRPDCAPRPPRASARRPAAGSARPTERNTSRFP